MDGAATSEGSGEAKSSEGGEFNENDKGVDEEEGRVKSERKVRSGALLSGSERVSNR